MLFFRTIQYAVFPTPEQAELLAKTFGCVRFIWNRMLSDCKEFMAATDRAFVPTPARYKAEFPFLKEVDSLALANTQLALNEALKKSREEKNIGFPGFKSKKKAVLSYTTNNQNGTVSLRPNDGGIRLPKLGLLKAKIHRLPKSHWRLKTASVKQTRSGKYFCALGYEYEEFPPAILPTKETGLGLDYSSPKLHVDSHGREPEYPRFFRQAEKRLAREQRKITRMQRGSNHYIKQQQKIQLLQEHTANQRKDFLHKLSREIANSCSIVRVEDLDLRSMAGSLRLGKSTNDNGFGMFRLFLQYKLEEQGKAFVKIPRHYPSSQRCGACGFVNAEVRNLAVREWTCPSCGAHHDRDVNAARNILDVGLELFFAPEPVEKAPVKKAHMGRKAIRKK